MDLKRFEEPNRISTLGDNVSIYAHGQLGISAVFKKYFSQYEYVDLYYDAIKKTMGIKPVKSAAHYSKKISFYGNEKGDIKRKTMVITVRHFLAFHGIHNESKRTVHPARWDNKKKMLIVEMGKESPELLEGK